jgi:hypothetical protein
LGVIGEFARGLFAGALSLFAGAFWELAFVSVYLLCPYPGRDWRGCLAPSGGLRGGGVSRLMLGRFSVNLLSCRSISTPLCAAAVTFFAAAKKVTKESSLSV